jgi:hypothetical protein
MHCGVVHVNDTLDWSGVAFCVGVVLFVSSFSISFVQCIYRFVYIQWVGPERWMLYLMRVGVIVSTMLNPGSRRIAVSGIQKAKPS